MIRLTLLHGMLSVSSGHVRPLMIIVELHIPDARWHTFRQVTVNAHQVWLCSPPTRAVVQVAHQPEAAVNEET